MNAPRRLLILAGSAEARLIAQGAVALGWDVQAWLSETPRGPNPMPVPTELIRFQDGDHLAQRMTGFDTVIDASHGFDGLMTRAGFAAARALGLPFVGYERPVWALEEGWCAAASVGQAMTLIAPEARVFSATGWASLPEFADFPGASLMLRQTTVHTRAVPFPFVDLVFGDPPFTVVSETALFQTLNVDTLICRNLGGVPSRPKLDAAAALGCKVILIDRPMRPLEIELVGDVEAVLDWLDRQ